jgi:hypothetical protein
LASATHQSVGVVFEGNSTRKFLLHRTIINSRRRLGGKDMAMRNSSGIGTNSWLMALVAERLPAEAFCAR